MNEPREREMLIEEATTAWRPRTPDGIILEHPAWADLDPDSRGAVFDETVVARRLEKGMDDTGQSSTVRAVLGRLGRV